MSAKSRARNRFEPAPEPAIDPADQEDMAEAMEAFELAGINPRAGISKWVGAALGARERAMTQQRGGVEVVTQDGTVFPFPLYEQPRALREPTPYERAILGGMAHQPMYGGTVEPWRVDERRRRNRAARKSRKRNRQAAKR